MIFVEAVLIAIWILLLYISRDSGRKILLVAPVIVMVLELANQVLNGGAYYPPPLLLGFPGFDFPVAILLAGASFTYLIHRASTVMGRDREEVFYWLGVFGLTWFAVVLEFVFTNMGFWQYTGWSDYSAPFFFRNVPYLWVYGYHSAYVVASILTARLTENYTVEPLEER